MKYRVELFKTKERGWGLRALETIPEYSFIVCYTGVVRKKAGSGSDSPYIFELGKRSDFTANGKYCGEDSGGDRCAGYELRELRHDRVVMVHIYYQLDQHTTHDQIANEHCLLDAAHAPLWLSMHDSMFQQLPKAIECYFVAELNLAPCCAQRHSDGWGDCRRVLTCCVVAGSTCQYTMWMPRTRGT